MSLVVEEAERKKERVEVEERRGEEVVYEIVVWMTVEIGH